MSKGISRRDVLRGSAAAVATVAIPGAAMAATEAIEPVLGPDSEIKPTGRGKLRLGIVGCGGKGWSGMQGAAEFGEVVCIADVDVENRIKAMQEHPRARTFEDYREMYEAMRGKIDAVVVSTPDHHHLLASVLAMKQGIHTYCEKPLTRSIWEARQMAEIAKKNRVATQMGNQSTASTPMRKIAKLLREGHYGKVKEIHLWTDRAARYWKQGIERPAAARTPRKVNFDLWLGPSADRPYGEGYHPFAWRGFWDFGTGALGDMGCHIFNMVFMALDLKDPLAVTAKTSGHNRDSFPTWAEVHYEFPKNKNRDAVDLFWYDGGKKPPQSLVPDVEFGGNGVVVVCEKGTIYSPDESNTTFRVIGNDFPDVEVEVSPGHMAEFARAAMEGKQAMSNFPHYSGPLTETVLLGNLAIWADGKRVEWDARRMTTKGTNEFDSLIRPTYREGWGI